MRLKVTLLLQCSILKPSPEHCPSPRLTISLQERAGPLGKSPKETNLGTWTTIADTRQRSNSVYKALGTQRKKTKKRKKCKGRGRNNFLRHTIKSRLAGFKWQPERLWFTFLTIRMIKDYLQTWYRFGDLVSGQEDGIDDLTRTFYHYFLQSYT